MTEKRFTIDEDGNITDTETDRTLYVENKYTECNYFVRLLNTLNEENEQLKKEILWWKYLCGENIEKENEELQHECNYLQNRLDDFINVQKENEKLKQTNQELYDELQETMSYKALKMGEVSILEKEIEQLKSKLLSKEALIQQLKNELNSDCYKESRKYQNEFIRVCEELTEMNQDYKKILEENKELKQRNNR